MKEYTLRTTQKYEDGLITCYLKENHGDTVIGRFEYNEVRCLQNEKINYKVLEDLPKSVVMLAGFHKEVLEQNPFSHSIDTTIKVDEE